MEIEYIRIKRVNLEIEKGLCNRAGCDMHSFNPADGLLFFPYLLLLNVTTAEKPDRQTSFTHTTDVYTEPEKRYEWNNKNSLH